MSTTGSYYITQNGRKFLVEPIGRAQEKVFYNGGTDGTSEKNKSTPQGGSIDNKESQITEENGFKDIVFIGPHMSPDNYISHIVNNNLRLNDPEEIKKGFARLKEK